MPKVLTRSANPLYRSLFPSWEGTRPLEWFLMENLLEARRKSAFPTNTRGPDEDVNVYLAHLLGDLLAAPEGPASAPGADPLLLPPAPGDSPLQRAHRYRRHADQRLLAAGLFDRGELLRRRRTPWGWDAAASDARDRGVGRTCYGCAAGLLAGRPGQEGLAAVLTKLADHFDDYVAVLAGLASDRLGLGARLSPVALEHLLAPAPAAGPAPTPRPPRPGPGMDHLLDLLLDYRRDPGEETARRLAAEARVQGLDPAPWLAPAADPDDVNARNRT